MNDGLFVSDGGDDAGGNPCADELDRSGVVTETAALG